MSSTTPPRWVVPSFFLAVLLLGLALFRDYGVSWDEPIDQYNGVVNVNYVGQQLGIPTLAEGLEDYPDIPPLREYPDRDHGPAFEYPVLLFSKLLGARDSQPLYYLRHLCTFLITFGGLLAFYGLAKRRFADWRLGLLAAFWLLATPRLFAEGFYNAKDAVFLSFFTISMYTLAELLHAPNWRRGLWHGLACGAAIGLRVNGVLLLPLTVLGAVLTAAATPALRRQLASSLLAWVPLTAGTAVLLWPWLWEAPWQNLVTAFENLSSFQRLDSPVFYRGVMENTLRLPWHYPFVWIVITTPLVYLGAFALGLLLLLRRVVGYFPHLWRTAAGRLDVLFGAWLFGPLVAVLVLHSVLYDGWRHLYFIYPALLLFAVSGMQQLLRARRTGHSTKVRSAAAVLLGLTALGSLEPLWRIVRDHPHQQVYFNNLLSADDIENGYERDYWGLSYRQGLEWILQHDDAPRIRVATQNNGLLKINLRILSPAERARLEVVPKEQADYFLGFYRWHPQPYLATEGLGWAIHHEYSNGVKILSIQRREQPASTAATP
ncbi:ArnT family glycosyltransferase [Hymenobacter busanensis]|uniref:ArnT family glycosyltransferase n=1 Tax=Hymenobacter busanensis TaxID=2607656 RepID=UPI001366ADC2|nr:glycosyltransferase family 39 protein [Hymenobacter busanensis]QHJ08445.1 hypothetical protein GUY19_14585 [Hymenobacter busanensis]